MRGTCQMWYTHLLRFREFDLKVLERTEGT